MMAVLLVPDLGAQQLTGRVTNSQTGEPIAAVQVFIAGSGIGALSQQNGRFLLLNVPPGTHTLTAERIGYRAASQQVSVTAGQTAVVDFSMSEEALGLDEIIVTGTPGGTQRRAIGNAVTAVAAAEVTQTVVMNNMQDLLTGRSPGVTFLKAPGQVGQSSPIQIRGISTFNLSSNPLIYVDGVRINNTSEAGPMQGGEHREVNPLDDINPADIESIEIIKGPAAATLYGTEASAGVIQVITKRGAEGAPQFDVAINQGLNYMRDPAGRLGLKWACRSTFNPPCAKEDIFSYNPYVDTNRLLHEYNAFEWPLENLYQNGHSQSYDVSVRGGTQSIRYFVSTNLDDAVGILWYNTDQTFRTRANLGVVLSDKFTFDVSTSYIDGETQFMQQVPTDGGEWDDMRWGNAYCAPWINPGACPRLLGLQEHLPDDVARMETRRQYNTFTGSATLNFTPTAWLTSRAIFGMDRLQEKNSNLWPLEVEREPVYEEMAVGTIWIEKPTTTNLSFDWSATGRYNVTSSIGTATSIGAQYFVKTFEKFGNKGSGFASPLSTTINQTPPSTAELIYEFTENKSLGFYVQEELSWNNRVFLTAAMRFDDNSAFGSEFDLEKYPKVAATWVVSEEGFWNFETLNSLRLRGALGKAGRQPDTFAGTNVYAVVPGPGGAARFQPKSPGNPKVGPETSTEIELGFDAAAFEDRIAAEFTYFYKRNESSLLNVALPPSEGFNGASQQNLGQIDNWGWEAAVNTQVYESPSFGFDLALTAAFVDNEIKSLGTFPGTNSIRIGFPYPNFTFTRELVDARFDPAGPIRDARGQRIVGMCRKPTPLGDGPQYGYVRGGADAEVVPCQQVPSSNRVLVGPGFVKYKFSVTPTITLLNNSVQIHALVDGSYGRWMPTSTSYDPDYENKCVCDPFIGAERGFGAWWAEGGAHSNTSTYLADFWKLREVGLRYTLPQSLVARIGAERASIAVSGRELANLWVKNNGEVRRPRNIDAPGLSIADPELTRQELAGAAHRSMPPLTTLNAALRVSF
jgi:TonB-linked SusC/RagA family outer membrane protein